MKICPRCRKRAVDLQALSRRDNKTYICSQCGTAEALFDTDISYQIKQERQWLDNPDKIGPLTDQTITYKGKTYSVVQLGTSMINHATKEDGYSNSFYYIFKDLRGLAYYEELPDADDIIKHEFFDEEDSNHEIEEKLRTAKVINKKQSTDSEYSCFEIHSKTKKPLQDFIQRINTYLVEKAKVMIHAKEM